MVLVLLDFINGMDIFNILDLFDFLVFKVLEIYKYFL